jgi:hypothetical protein
VWTARYIWQCLLWSQVTSLRSRSSILCPTPGRSDVHACSRDGRSICMKAKASSTLHQPWSWNNSSKTTLWLLRWRLCISSNILLMIASRSRSHSQRNLGLNMCACIILHNIVGDTAKGPARLPQRSFTPCWRLRWNSLITSSKFLMVHFVGWQSHGRGWRSWSTDIVDRGMDMTKGWRPCCNGDSTKGMTSPKVWSWRCHGVGTRVDSRLVGHRNNCQSWMTIITLWPCTCHRVATRVPSKAHFRVSEWGWLESLWWRVVEWGERCVWGYTRTPKI